ncbi:Hypothetical protein NTJ_03473 [Nesidiocoris tenuis]|uniref:Uncharacterized protein n=1 Tax=Nesidiocoris tenuis TaxID=355587 RepID=A0ABN7AEF3_9HEMI|nr:Hypothetical protein NTJ_03473 [Nesidiocoris tenuis]
MGGTGGGGGVGGGGVGGRSGRRGPRRGAASEGEGSRGGEARRETGEPRKLSVRGRTEEAEGERAVRQAKEEAGQVMVVWRGVRKVADRRVKPKRTWRIQRQQEGSCPLSGSIRLPSDPRGRHPRPSSPPPPPLPRVDTTADFDGRAGAERRVPLHPRPHVSPPTVTIWEGARRVGGPSGRRDAKLVCEDPRCSGGMRANRAPRRVRY